MRKKRVPHGAHLAKGGAASNTVVIMCSDSPDGPRTFRSYSKAGHTVVVVNSDRASRIMRKVLRAKSRAYDSTLETEIARSMDSGA